MEEEAKPPGRTLEKREEKDPGQKCRRGMKDCLMTVSVFRYVPKRPTRVAVFDTWIPLSQFLVGGGQNLEGKGREEEEEGWKKKEEEKGVVNIGKVLIERDGSAGRRRKRRV